MNHVFIFVIIKCNPRWCLSPLFINTNTLTCSWVQLCSYTRRWWQFSTEYCRVMVHEVRTSYEFTSDTTFWHVQIWKNPLKVSFTLKFLGKIPVLFLISTWTWNEYEAVEIVVKRASHSSSVAGGGSTFLWNGRRTGQTQVWKVS